jgi:hypothetical protein
MFCCIMTIVAYSYWFMCLMVLRSFMKEIPELRKHYTLGSMICVLTGIVAVIGFFWETHWFSHFFFPIPSSHSFISALLFFAERIIINLPNLLNVVIWACWMYHDKGLTFLFPLLLLRHGHDGIHTCIHTLIYESRIVL